MKPVSGNEIPASFKLYQNYPNPFNPATTIKFELPLSVTVNITVFDMMGEKVKELLNERLEAGYHEIIFRAENLASGMYIYRLVASDHSTTSGQLMFIDVKKMILLK